MPTPSAPRVDRASLVISANAAEVFDAFADGTTLVAWLPPDGMTGRALEYDFREGGRYRIELTYGDAVAGEPGKTTGRTDVSAGRFLELEAGKRIVQTVEFDSDDPAFAGEMRMTWTFEPVPGGTDVEVRASNVPPGIRAADHEVGLRDSLENLARHLRKPK